MAQDGDSGEKTEQPTGRRKNEARSQGQVGQSRELAQVFGITAAFIALQYIAPSLWRDLKYVTASSLTSRYSTEPLDAQVLRTIFYALVLILIPEILLMLGISALFGAGCSAVQTKFLFSWKMLRPKLSLLHPIRGLKRILGVQNSVQTLKALIKLGIICPIAYFAFFELFPSMLSLIDVPVSHLLPFTATAATSIFRRIMSWLLLLAIIDLIWQKWHTYKQLKMSKWEVKEERKAVEGDERMRRRIISIGMSRLRERMLRAVPQADVVVTNPTHISVALKYTMQPGTAPKVLAKGKGYVALRIQEIARQHGVPVIERKPLARALFKACEVGQEIPYEFYKAVAELLAYVYKLKGKIPFSSRARRTAEDSTNSEL